jgi:hypothetical protein
LFELLIHFVVDGSYDAAIGDACGGISVSVYIPPRFILERVYGIIYRHNDKKENTFSQNGACCGIYGAVLSDGAMWIAGGRAVVGGASFV